MFKKQPRNLAVVDVPQGLVVQVAVVVTLTVEDIVMALVASLDGFNLRVTNSKGDQTYIHINSN